MGIFVPALTLVIGWLLAIFHVAAPGAVATDTFADSAMRWALFLPGGCMFLASAFMHTVLAKRTAKEIGWETNGFQYEIGFVSLGLGVAGIIAAQSTAPAWLPIAVAQSIFLALAGINHIREMITKKNFAPGNTIILIYDFGLPISYAALLILIAGQ